MDFIKIHWSSYVNNKMSKQNNMNKEIEGKHYYIEACVAR